jgi:hypothetical protein
MASSVIGQWPFVSGPAGAAADEWPLTNASRS